MELTPVQIMVLRTLSRGGPMDAEEVRAASALTMANAAATLEILALCGLAVRSGERYALTGDGERELYLYNTI